MSGTNINQNKTTSNSTNKIGIRSSRDMTMRLGEQIEENIRNHYFEKKYVEDNKIDKIRTILREKSNKIVDIGRQIVDNNSANRESEEQIEKERNFKNEIKNLENELIKKNIENEDKAQRLKKYSEQNQINEIQVKQQQQNAKDENEQQLTKDVMSTVKKIEAEIQDIKLNQQAIATNTQLLNDMKDTLTNISGKIPQDIKIQLDEKLKLLADDLKQEIGKGQKVMENIDISMGVEDILEQIREMKIQLDNQGEKLGWQEEDMKEVKELIEYQHTEHTEHTYTVYTVYTA